MLLDLLSTAAKGSVSKVRAGWVEVEKFGESDLELAIGETGFHVLDAFDMWQAGDVVEEGWCGPAADLLMDLKGCSAAEFPGLQYECGGDGSIALEGFGEKSPGH